MAKFFVCQKCKKYYSEDDYIKLTLFKFEPRTRVCQRCGSEMTHERCFRQESFH